MSIRLEIYRAGQRATDYAAVAPMAVAAESVPIPGDVAFKDGCLRVLPVDGAATAAGLLWDCGTAGEYHLETTRLMPRQRPYVLNVELARHRLMKILQKVEDWGLLDSMAAKGPVDQLKALQARFAEALAQPDAGKASLLADAVLTESLQLGDELALFAAEQTLTRRKAQNSFARYVFGCRVDWTLRNQRVKDLMADSFDYAVVPFTWKLIQPAEDRYDTAALDEWMEFLSRRRIPVIAGPLVELSELAIPAWAYVWEHDFDVLRDLLVDFVRKMVTRYRRAVAVWNVVGGLHASSIPGLSFEQTIELTRLLVATVKSMLPQARTLVGIKDPFGEHHATSVPGVPPMLYADTVAQAGVNCDGFALELETGVPRTGGYTRDLFQLSCAIDRLSGTGKPVYITAVCAPSRNNPDPADRSEGKLDPAKAGRWNAPWSPRQQADWVERIARIALGKPFVESLTWGDLADANASIPGGGLVDDLFQPKLAFHTIQTLRTQYQRREKKA